MSIKVKMSEMLRYFTAIQDIVEVDGSTVGQCLDHLVKQFPGAKKWLFDKHGKLRALIFVNGESTYVKELARLVEDGDELHIVLIIGGG